MRRRIRMQWALALALLVIGPVVCGGGSDTPAPAPPETPPAPSQPPSPPPETPVPPPETPPVTTDTPALPEGNALDVSYVSADYFAAVIVHPQRIAKASLVAPLLESEMVQPYLESAGFRPDDFQRIVVLAPAPDPQRLGPDVNVVTIVARFVEPVDAIAAYGH